MAPECIGYKLQEGDDVQGTGLRSGGFAVEEKIEEFEADRVPLSV